MDFRAGAGTSRPPYTYYVDTELHIIHLFYDCSGLKMARRYDYREEFKLMTPEDGAKLDEQGRPCHTCWKRENHWARKDGRNMRPGFKTEPRK